ncbi:hypothetical protein PVAP13_1KG027233 [Panicum virgatum]|uniref:Uncharacterized protein n=1 Tax=Panicum virgatum TaxID=38727 RepID=A0A8T0XCN4_PANVG|nr:hypothetical protein PVAP13_1KG027233 [Panicum virgatum]
MRRAVLRPRPTASSGTGNAVRRAAPACDLDDRVADCSPRPICQQARNKVQARPPFSSGAPTRLAGRSPGRRGGRGRRSAPRPGRARRVRRAPRLAVAAATGGGGGAEDGDTAHGTRACGGTHLSKSKQLAGRRAVVSSGQQTLSPITDRESFGKVPGVLHGRPLLADEPERRRAALPRQPDGDDPAADRVPPPGRCSARRPPLIVTPELRGAPRTAAPSFQVPLLL